MKSGRAWAATAQVRGSLPLTRVTGRDRVSCVAALSWLERGRVVRVTETDPGPVVRRRGKDGSAVRTAHRFGADSHIGNPHDRRVLANASVAGQRWRQHRERCQRSTENGRRPPPAPALFKCSPNKTCPPLSPVPTPLSPLRVRYVTPTTRPGRLLHPLSRRFQERFVRNSELARVCALA